jgi:hypothetical protein
VGAEMSPRSMSSTAAALLHHTSPPSIHLHHPGGLTRIGSQNHLPQPVGGAAPASLGYSMATYNSSNQPEKEGYVKPMTASAVLTAAMGRVRSSLDCPMSPSMSSCLSYVYSGTAKTVKYERLLHQTQTRLTCASNLLPLHIFRSIVLI